MRSQNFPKDCFPKALGQLTSLRLHGFPINTLDWNIRSLGDLWENQVDYILSSLPLLNPL